MASLSEAEVSFWMDRAVMWGEATAPSAQKDLSKHLGSLKIFLQRLLHTLQPMSSTTEAMKTLPFVGQFLGRLCWNPYVTADGECSKFLMQCVCHLYSTNPENALETRANEWIRNLLCHLTSEEEGGVMQALEKHSGSTPQQYYSETLKKMVALLTEAINESSANSLERCSCDTTRAVSVMCVPLVTCDEVAPLINALLKLNASCGCLPLSEQFIETVNTAWLSEKLVLEDTAVVALWCNSLSSLESAVLSLLECVLSDTGTAAQSLQKLVTDSLLPKASALHCHIFLIVTDVFRNALIALEQNVAVRALVQLFTGCFIQCRSVQKPQDTLPLRTFFPHVPHSFLTPLLTSPSEVPKPAWLEHLNMITGFLQKILQEGNQGEEEEEEEDSLRRRRAAFEAWFFLVQCGQWVDVAAELLVSSGAEEADTLLLLLTLYHYPTTRGHQSARQTTMAREAWAHLRSLFLVHPLPQERVFAVKELLSSTLSASLIVHLLLNFAIFSQAPTSSTAEVVQKVLTEPGLRRSATWILSSVQNRLNRDSVLNSRVHSRLRMLQDSLLIPAHASGSA